MKLPPWIISVALLVTGCAATALADVTDVVRATQPKLVKIYGAGGIRGLEAYQSGVLISADGFVLTAWSYVLDADPILVTLHDGQRCEAMLQAMDPHLEIALLKIDVPLTDFFDLEAAVELTVGDRVLAFSNLYGIATGDEPVSVQRGVVTGVADLDARRGTYQTPYTGRVYVTDAMCNNAGAAGGALTDWRGRLAGILGKELRNRQNGIWLNYAIPISELREAVRSLRTGNPRPTTPANEATLPRHPWTLTLLGIQLVPDVLPQTPPYVEALLDNDFRQHALQPDDLIMFVRDRLVRSQREVVAELQRIAEHEPLTLVVLRGQELVTVTIEPAP